VKKGGKKERKHTGGRKGDDVTFHREEGEKTLSTKGAGTVSSGAFQEDLGTNKSLASGGEYGTKEEENNVLPNSNSRCTERQKKKKRVGKKRVTKMVEA